MTVSTTQIRVSYTGDGSSVNFPIPFPFYLPTDLLVLLAGVTITTGFSVSGGGGSTGTLAMTTAPAVAANLQIILNVPLTQLVNLVDGTAFPSATINQVNDRTVQAELRLNDLIIRSIRAPDGDVSPGMSLPSAQARASQYLAFDSNGNVLATAALPGTSNSQTSLAAILNPQIGPEAGPGVSNYVPLPYDPLRYGAVGDGVADDTAAMNRWVAVINATTGPVSSVWTAGKIYLCGPITTITGNDVSVNMNGCTILVKANSWTSTTHLNFSGARTRLINGKMDGNQAAFGAPPVLGACQLLQIGNDFRLQGMSFIDAAGRGVLMDTIGKGQATDCHFDSNANLGIQFAAASYITFVDCTFDFNGYGFQGTFSPHGAVGTAFGLALRYRSHHITFTGCRALQNGRDGMNVNQGSYAIKFIGCLAWMNNDGGFTIAADNTSTGRLGESESPYDLEYIDCEAYNNWGSGLVAYAAVYNLTVEGGRYYNNQRSAGVLAFASANFNGIYIASGSLSIRIRAKAYDDRQYCPVTGNAAGVIAATGWVAGTMTNYPAVALYNAALAFQGYGYITAESAGSVTVTTAANNGVTVVSIAAGWFITQRVQHNGALLDNNCQGFLDIDGFGFLPGVAGTGYSGYKNCSGGFASGQNVQVPSYQLDPNAELLVNPTLDGGVTSWTFAQSGSGGAMNAYSTLGNNLRSAGAMQLLGGTAGSSASSSMVTNALQAANGAFIEASAWVNAVNAGDCSLVVSWQTSFLTQVQHPGGGWKLLKIGAFFPPGTANLIAFQIFSAVNKTNYIDNASMRVRFEGTDSRDTTYPTRNLPV